MKRSDWMGHAARLATLVSALAAAALALRTARSAANQDRGSVPLPPAPPGPSEDELDKEQLEQLHAATLKASDACFEIKKLCATVLVPAATLVSIFTNKDLDLTVLVSAGTVVIVFWLADAVAYYYQRRLRNTMALIWRRRAARCDDYAHIPKIVHVHPIRALFNGSMAFYFILLSVDVIAIAIYVTGEIGKQSGVG